MNEALQSGKSRERTGLTPLHLFAAILLAKPDDLSSARTAALVATAQRDADRAVKNKRAPVEKRGALPYALLYRKLRASASKVVLTGVPVRGSVRARTLVALCTLRHRQRAVAVLHHVAGLTIEEVAEVIGASRAETLKVVRAADSKISSILGRPVDIGAAIRVGGERRSSKNRAHVTPDVVPLPEKMPERPPARMPRAVFRTLVAPPVQPGGSEPPEPAETESEIPTIVVPLPPAAPRFVAQLRLPLESAPPVVVKFPTPPLVRSTHERTRYSRRRAMLAAAIVAVLTLTLGPVTARSGLPVVATVTNPIPQIPHGTTAISPAAVPAPSVAPSVVVRAGDTLWAIAGRTLGDPSRWHEIWALNLGVVMTAGERFLDPDLIRPGWKLVVPLR